MNPRLLSRALALFLVAASASGCCQAIGTICDCANCLLSGPRLPGAAPEPTPTHEAKAPAARPTSMRY
ncbi:MAG: hypothetical protein A2138_28010 [Deltaproteobacteria bacterium RBG_16_71_12]|nr:MAG: hypothetical protein A2138_28010 [Deltaproteobacteria bacterium RBG_16_71_12]